MQQLFLYIRTGGLKMEQFGFTVQYVLHPKDADGMTSSVDPDQTAS